MTFEKIQNDLASGRISPKDAYKEVTSKNNWKTINYYLHLDNISNEPLNDQQLQELNAIVNVMQTLYYTDAGTPLSDPSFDILQEMLVNMGVPRMTGEIELNSANKVAHQFTSLRGTLDKVYYLKSTDVRTNKSRKYLDDWIKSMEDRYKKATGEVIDLNRCYVLLQPKFDGVSCVLEVGDKLTWLTRGDTRNNLASDVSHIMKEFNDIYSGLAPGTGVKFELMVTEDDKDRVNEFNPDHPYKNSRQIVTSTLNSTDADYKVDYLWPVPLRIIHKGEDIETIHPDLVRLFPTMTCKLGDRDAIHDFAMKNKVVEHANMKFRTDGVVITIMDPHIQRVLGRENDINRFEIAYKFTEEKAYSRVKDVEFYVSEFGFITPVLVVNDVILKGNTVRRISLSNKERFDELGLCYGDEVCVLYDIIPYVTIDEKCRKSHGRKIDFTDRCPACGHKLDLNQTQVQCKNSQCPTKIIGRMLNYCSNLRIKNIGYETMKSLYDYGFLPDGICSLYQLKKHAIDIEMLDGFGRTKTRKIINEIESKRSIKDYELFGSIGIESLSMKTFRSIFSQIKLEDFLVMIQKKKFDDLMTSLIRINGIGQSKADVLVEYFKDSDNTKNLFKLIKMLRVSRSYGYTPDRGRIVFSGCRPSPTLETFLRRNGYDVSDSWSNSAAYLVIPSSSYESNKVSKARDHGVPVIALNNRSAQDVLMESIPGLK